jgi:hypothetical protein
MNCPSRSLQVFVFLKGGNSQFFFSCVPTCNQPTHPLLIYPRKITRAAIILAPTPRDLVLIATAGSLKTREMAETSFLVALAEEEEEVAAVVNLVAAEEAAEDEAGGKGFYLAPWTLPLCNVQAS